MPALLVLGARNLGATVLDHFLGLGWAGAGVARSAETLDRVRERGALAIEADAGDVGSLSGALGQVREAYGSVDLVVNATTSGARSGSPFGGGPLAHATLEDFRHWGGEVAERCFAFLSCGARALREQGRGGTLVQVTGGSSRRAMPGKGSWAAGAFATRALVQAAAQELRQDGIHVALLVVDATIASPKTESFTRDAAPDALADERDVARAVQYLAEQDRRAWSHELTLTPAGERWVP